MPGTLLLAGDMATFASSSPHIRTKWWWRYH